LMKNSTLFDSTQSTTPIPAGDDELSLLAN
jgi:hypothetical protein